MTDDLKKWGGASGQVRTLPLPSVRPGAPLLVHDEDAAVHDEALVILREAHANDGDAPVSQRLYDQACNLARARLGRTLDAVNPLTAIRADFSGDDPVDTVSAIVHAKATTVLRAAKKEVTEESYLAALRVVAKETGGRGDDELEKELDTAAAISDLASHRLAEQGFDEDADAFIAEYQRVEREFGVGRTLDHYDNA